MLEFVYKKNYCAFVNGNCLMKRPSLCISGYRNSMAALA